MASPLEQAFGWVKDNADEIAKNAWRGIKYSPMLGPGLATAEWALTDPGNSGANNRSNNQPYLGRTPEEMARKNAYAQMASDREARQRAQMLERFNAINSKINDNQWLRQQAIRQINPIYRPQIRGLRRDIRQTMAQGRRSANQVEGFYDAANRKVAGMQRAGRKQTRQAVRNVNRSDVNIGAKGISNAEGKMAAKAVAGMGKAGNSFMKQLRGAITAEGGIAAADTLRSYQGLANDKRSDLAKLRSERAAAVAQSAAELKKKYAKAGSKVYQQGFLGSIQAGNSVGQAMKQMNNQLSSANPAIRSKVAQMIMANRGNYRNQIAQLNQATDEEKQQIFDNTIKALAEVRQAGESAQSNGQADYAKQKQLQYEQLLRQLGM